MVKTVTERDFVQAFKTMGRENNFSNAGLSALFDYLEELENETGQPIELDVIALCCDYSEYENLAEFQKDYGEEYESMDDVRDATTVIKVDDEAFIIQQF